MAGDTCEAIHQETDIKYRAKTDVFKAHNYAAYCKLLSFGIRFSDGVGDTVRMAQGDDGKIIIILSLAGMKNMSTDEVKFGINEQVSIVDSTELGEKFQEILGLKEGEKDGIDYLLVRTGEEGNHVHYLIRKK